MNVVVCGPPCKTWSAARFRALVEQALNRRRPPRPVRSTASPFGIQGLTAKEYEQGEIGNTLLFVALECFLESLLAGGLALIEHLADAGPDKPSIFKLGVVARLLNARACRKYTFLQGRLGQIMPKPTTCLTCRLPAIQRFKDNFSTLHCAQSGGQLDSTGAFATAAAKTYQARFCAAIAASIAHPVHSDFVDELGAEWLLRHFKFRCSSLLVDVEEYSGGDEMPAIPPSLPDDCVHSDEISELLGWCVDDYVRGPDFNPESIAHLA